MGFGVVVAPQEGIKDVEVVLFEDFEVVLGNIFHERRADVSLDDSASVIEESRETGELEVKLRSCTIASASARSIIHGKNLQSKLMIKCWSALISRLNFTS